MIQDSAKVLRLRNEIGMSQKDLANRLGVQEDIIKSWERGWRTPPQHMLNKIRRLRIGCLTNR